MLAGARCGDNMGKRRLENSGIAGLPMADPILLQEHGLQSMIFRT
jgi:hypothetical protein